MIARLEGDVESGAASAFAGGFESDDFGVIAPVILVKTLANHLAALGDFAVAGGFAVANDDAADSGIGAGESNAFAREGESVLHEANVVVSYGCGHGWGKSRLVTAQVKKDSAQILAWPR